MPEYRFYSIKKDGHVAGPATIRECSLDVDALKQARQLLNGNDIEIWQDARVVAYLVSEES